ncbi:MBL fold metallo-hydrolase [Candidatus Pacearchaeota archaeon CG10_big_fil_rev_8_21_14_0_10_35_13]|nr:MAG: MBL fold metallo-hydrolase [Candidatus Pacearchaeota archaeon CG10_big_fil_rev_8_21_14_0_10_35_13]
MEFSALASGSSGNSFYVGNSKTGVGILIDAGINCKTFEERMKSINRSPLSIKGIFITHEHTDHIKGADVISRKYGIPVYATKKTFDDRFIAIEERQEVIKNDETINVGGMMIETFKKNHGASDPVSFNIQTNDKKISVITDVGKACDNIHDNINESDLLCIEANHDPDMLIEGKYPWFLKKWILSDTGHLSNKQSALAVLEHARPKMKRIVLSHLSAHNNTPEVAMETYKKLIKERRDLQPTINVSVREYATPVMKI